MKSLCRKICSYCLHLWLPKESKQVINRWEIINQSKCLIINVTFIVFSTTVICQMHRYFYQNTLKNTIFLSDNSFFSALVIRIIKLWNLSFVSKNHHCLFYFVLSTALIILIHRILLASFVCVTKICHKLSVWLQFQGIPYICLAYYRNSFIALLHSNYSSL